MVAPAPANEISAHFLGAGENPVDIPVDEPRRLASAYDGSRHCAGGCDRWSQARPRWRPSGLSTERLCHAASGLYTGVWSHSRNAPMQRANSVSSRDIAFTLHPYTNLKKHETEGPLVVTEGRGIYVYDENGKEYIEGMAGLWCTALGFSEERLVDAATRQLKRLPFYHL